MLLASDEERYPAACPGAVESSVNQRMQKCVKSAPAKSGLASIHEYEGRDGKQNLWRLLSAVSAGGGKTRRKSSAEIRLKPSAIETTGTRQRHTAIQQYVHSRRVTRRPRLLASCMIQRACEHLARCLLLRRATSPAREIVNRHYHHRRISTHHLRRMKLIILALAKLTDKSRSLRPYVA